MRVHCAKVVVWFPNFFFERDESAGNFVAETMSHTFPFTLNGGGGNRTAHSQWKVCIVNFTRKKLQFVKKNVYLWGGECVDFSFSPNVTLNYCYTSISSIWTSWVLCVARCMESMSGHICSILYLPMKLVHHPPINKQVLLYGRWHEISFSSMNRKKIQHLARSN